MARFRHGSVLPPPRGLDVHAIATETGLLAALEREANTLVAMKDRGELPRDDTIRLISFLAGAIRRRGTSLTEDQKAALDAVHHLAREREAERRVHEVVQSARNFIERASMPRAEIPYAKYSQIELALEANIRDMARTFHWKTDLIKDLDDARDALLDLDRTSGFPLGLEAF